MAHKLEKAEKRMNAEEKIQLEVARTMMAARGNNLRESKIDFDFRNSSNVMKMAKAIITRFEVGYRDPKEAKIFWPEKEVTAEDEATENKGDENRAEGPASIDDNEDSSDKEVTDEPASKKKRGSKHEEATSE